MFIASPNVVVPAADWRDDGMARLAHAARRGLSALVRRAIAGKRAVWGLPRPRNDGIGAKRTCSATASSPRQAWATDTADGGF